MAKRKNSTALFEVIRQIEPYQRSRGKPSDEKAAGPGLLDRGKLWLLSKLDVARPIGKATPEKMAANPNVSKSPIGKIVSRGNGNSGSASRLAAAQRAISADVAAQHAAGQNSTVITTNSTSSTGNSAASASVVLRVASADLENGITDEVSEIPETPVNPYPPPASESAIAPLLAQAPSLKLAIDPTDDSQEYVSDESDQFQTGDSNNASEAYDDVTRPQTSAPMAVAVDSQRKKISLHMSYKAAMGMAAVLLFTIALSIVIGQKITRNGSPLLSKTTTDSLRKGPAHPEVLTPPRTGFRGADDVTPRNTTPRQPQQARDIIDPKKPDKNQWTTPGNTVLGNNTLGNNTAPNTPEKAPFAAPSTEDGKRYIGFNYAIIQGYPQGEEKMAREAVQFLNREGVRCTIEYNIAKFQQITIVGLDGFPRVSTSDWIAYKQKIQQLSTKYTSDKKGFKAFNPVPKKWDRVE